MTEAITRRSEKTAHNAFHMPTSDVMVLEVTCLTFELSLKSKRWVPLSRHAKGLCVLPKGIGLRANNRLQGSRCILGKAARVYQSQDESVRMHGGNLKA